MTAMQRPAASIWLRPERSAVGRPPQWSRAEITQVALRVADAEGLDAVSMRRVAAELGTGEITEEAVLGAAFGAAGGGTA